VSAQEMICSACGAHVEQRDGIWLHWYDVDRNDDVEPSHEPTPVVGSPVDWEPKSG
jgi:hypothetical protein